MAPTSFNANNSGYPQSVRLSPDERQKAEETTKAAVDEAKQYSNPAIPLPLKITGLAVLAFVIWKTG